MIVKFLEDRAGIMAAIENIWIYQAAVRHDCALCKWDQSPEFQWHVMPARIRESVRSMSRESRRKR